MTVTATTQGDTVVLWVAGDPDPSEIQAAADPARRRVIAFIDHKPPIPRALTSLADAIVLLPALDHIEPELASTVLQIATQ